jgi:hypothetical protein
MSKVIIVGNGRISKNYGELINSFDIVARINKFRIHTFEHLVGTKTTHVFLSEAVCEVYDKTDQELIKEFNATNKQTMKNLFEYYGRNKKAKEQVQLYKSNQLFLPNRNLNCEFISLTDKKYSFAETKSIRNSKNVSTGFAAIEYFVNSGYNPTIVGFDFFQKTSCYWLKNSDIFTEERLITDRTINFTDGHDYKLEQKQTQFWRLTNRLKIL